MVNSVEWRSLGVLSAEGMSLRVGAFKASDGEVVELSSDVLKKIFSKVRDPVPMYLTHKDAGRGVPRTVLGHAVKLGLEANGDKILYKALMMDPTFKMIYAEGYDDTSAEIDPIRDDAGNIIDGTLTGIAVVPNPAIDGTQMRVAAMAFEAPSPATSLQVYSTNAGVSKLTGNKLEKTLLENGVPVDKVGAILEGAEMYFSKHFEQAGLQKKFEAAEEQVKLACSQKEAAMKEKDEVQKKFENLTKEFESHLGSKVDQLVAEVKTIGFASPEAVVEGLPVQQKIAMLSKMKENMIAAKPASAPSANLAAEKPAGDAAKNFEQTLLDMGLSEMWGRTHQATPSGGK